MHLIRTLTLSAAVAFASTVAYAQPPAPPEPERADPDALIDPLQPDFNLAALPTTLRMPVGKWAFRVTHRFTRPLGQGDFGDLLSDAFGFDGGAQIGLELRFGLLPGTQIGVHRTSERTIQIFGQQNILKERDGRPIGLDALATLEGTENLSERFQGALGVIVSRNVGRRLALYAEPMIVLNTSSATADQGENSTMLLGLGARARVRPSFYLFGEVSPRIAGNDPGKHQISFGLEGRAGGHLFQLNFSNGIGTTFGQISRGTGSYENWFLGFNIARKFF
jgi:hypothetical protein